MKGPRTVMKSGPHLPQLEKALAQKRRPNTAINKSIKKKKQPTMAPTKTHAQFIPLRMLNKARIRGELHKFSYIDLIMTVLLTGISLMKVELFLL